MASEWTTLPFREYLSHPLSNGVYKAKEFHGAGAKVVNMGELFANPRLSDIPMKRVTLTEREASRSLIAKGDLLFARRSLTAVGAGKCSVVLDVSEPTTFESSIIRARPNPSRADSLFMYYLFSSPVGTELMRSILRQVAVSGVTSSDLSGLILTVPPVTEQRRISSILDLLDRRAELLAGSNLALEGVARTIFKSWFVDFDPVRAKAEGREPEGMDGATAALFPAKFVESEKGSSIPSGWQFNRLSDFMDINPLRSLSKTAPAPYLEMASAPTAGPRPKAWVNRSPLSGCRFRNGDTLLAKITPCLENGKTAFVDFLPEEEVGWGSTEFIILAPKRPIPPVFGYLLARDEGFRAFAIQSMSGTSGRQRVQVDQLKTYEFPIASPAVYGAFGEIVEPMFAAISHNDNQAKTLSEVRDTLLPRLISGKLRVPEAEKLLEAVV